MSVSQRRYMVTVPVTDAPKGATWSGVTKLHFAQGSSTLQITHLQLTLPTDVLLRPTSRPRRVPGVVVEVVVRKPDSETPSSYVLCHLRGGVDLGAQRLRTDLRFTMEEVALRAYYECDAERSERIVGLSVVASLAYHENSILVEAE